MREQAGSYEFDRQVSDTRMSLVRKTIGLICFESSSFLQDTKQATDLVSLVSIDRLAVRIRNNDAQKYSGEITIRYGRTTTPSTEFQKICGGNASHMFYAIMNHDDMSFYWWVLLDLNIFRSLLKGDLFLINQFTIIPNKDGQSCFMVVPLRLVRECIVHSSVHLKNMMKDNHQEVACL